MSLVYNDTVDNEHFQVSVKALMRNDKGDVLIFKKNKDEAYAPTWDLAGGRIQKDESPIDTLHREVMEETNLTVVVKGLLASGLSGITVKSSLTQRSRLFLFLYLTEIEDEEKLKLGDEHEFYKWVSPKEASQLLDFYPEEIRNAIANL